MRKDCKNIWPQIVGMALGESNRAADAHLEECSECSRRFHQLQSLMAGLREGATNAPTGLVDAAKAIMPGRRRELMAKLIRSTRALAGVRGPESADAHALFEADRTKLRVQYRPLPRGWEVLGQAKGATAGSHKGRPFAVDASGRFTFEIDTLNNSTFRLRMDTFDIVVPSVKDVPGDEP